MNKRLGEEIPKYCHYWRFQGDHNMIGCQINGTLCRGNGCNIEEIDPTGLFRKRIDEARNVKYSKKLRKK